MSTTMSTAFENAAETRKNGRKAKEPVTVGQVAETLPQSEPIETQVPSADDAPVSNSGAMTVAAHLEQSLIEVVSDTAFIDSVIQAVESVEKAEVTYLSLGRIVSEYLDMPHAAQTLFIQNYIGRRYSAEHNVKVPVIREKKTDAGHTAHQAIAIAFYALDEKAMQYKGTTSETYADGRVSRMKAAYELATKADREAKQKELVEATNQKLVAAGFKPLPEPLPGEPSAKPPSSLKDFCIKVYRLSTEEQREQFNVFITIAGLDPKKVNEWQAKAIQ
jgi:hypothetical protein